MGRVTTSDYLAVFYIPDCGELTVFCLSIVGCGARISLFNFHPAKIFMGDTGSLALGGALGTVAILSKTEILLIIIGGVFVVEVLSVIIQVASYKLRRKRVFKMAPHSSSFRASRMGGRKGRGQILDNRNPLVDYRADNVQDSIKKTTANETNGGKR